jgi:N-acetyl-anhydromuramyl-L-alanine amidase AmpD
MHIINQTHICTSSRFKYRHLANIKKIVIHRIGFKGENYSPVKTILQGFLNDEAARKAVGGKFPYHFVIAESGEIYQALPLQVIGNHAKGHNEDSIAVAFIGDFRDKPPTISSYAAGLELVCRLCICCNIWESNVFGHTQLPKSTSWANHKCPGREFNIEKFTLILQQMLASTDEHGLKHFGITI